MKVGGLVKMEWVYQSKALYLHKKLIRLQNALNFNVKNLAQLVRDYFTLFAWLWINLITLQLNTTCDAYTSNCSRSTKVKGTVISKMEECISPIYHIVNTIAQHSSKLFKTIKNLQNVAIKSKNYNSIVATATNIEVNDLCLCDI